MNRLGHALLPLLAISLIVALCMPAASIADEPAVGAPASSPEVATPPASETPVAPTTTPSEGPPSTAPTPSPAPEVQSERAQDASPSGRSGKRASSPAGQAPAGEESGPDEEAGAGGTRAKRSAPSPSTLTPSLPLALRGSISGVPSFFIESFQIPPFLLPIFQAAGAAYGIPWQVLAAINEVETDYGRDLSVSSASAEGWMQFLPASWAQYGVDANGDGFKDPYNPADAIFAAARYLRAAGGDGDIKAAVFSYNHSQQYVSSVMLRAQLLGSTPAELLGAVTGLTEAHFPVHAASHFSDGFPTVPNAGAATTKTLVGTTIYSQAGAPVVAVQDGEVVQVGDSPALGHFVSLRDAYGNTYVYAQLGSVASVYPVLKPHLRASVSPRISSGSGEPAPSGPATAGAQPRMPLSEAATISGLTLGAVAGLEAAPSPPAPAPTPTPPAPKAPEQPSGQAREFTEGANDVYLRPLVAGVQVIAGTVLGHLAAAAAAPAHMVFQVRPAGPGAPLIDPKPILDGWVSLENTSVFRAKGENPFLATSPSVGQVLLESKRQLGPQVLRDPGIQLGRCGRQDVQEGRVDKRVLAMLEYLSVSGLKPTVAGLTCPSSPQTALAANASADGAVTALQITAVNGTAVAGHQGPGSIADTTVRKLLMLQGLSRPRRIVSLMSYPGAAVARVAKSADRAIAVTFGSLSSDTARSARLQASGLTPSGWLKLVARLGEIPDPAVGVGHSDASIPDTPGESAAGQSTGGARGDH